jgi:glycogen operon protein
VSYNGKHNEGNGEENRDGTDDNRSWNCGVEGPAEDPAINALRARQQRNFLATLFLSQGVPMLCAGDEIGRTQGGNNNAYCQDNEVSWVDWARASSERDLLRFTRRLGRLRSRHPVFRRRRFFHGATDIEWLTPAGEKMTDDDWHAGYAKAVAVFLNGAAISEPDPRGDPVTDSKFLMLFNAGPDPITFTLPEAKAATEWEVVVDTATPDGAPAGPDTAPKSKIDVTGRAVTILLSQV